MTKKSVEQMTWISVIAAIVIIFGIFYCFRGQKLQAAGTGNNYNMNGWGRVTAGPTPGPKPIVSPNVGPPNGNSGMPGDRPSYGGSGTSGGASSNNGGSNSGVNR